MEAGSRIYKPLPLLCWSGPDQWHSDYGLPSQDCRTTSAASGNLQRQLRKPDGRTFLPIGAPGIENQVLNRTHLVNFVSVNPSKRTMRMSSTGLLRFFLLLALCGGPAVAQNAAVDQGSKRATSTPYKG